MKQEKEGQLSHYRCISKFSDSFQYETENVNSTHNLIMDPIAKHLCPITLLYNNINLQHHGYIVTYAKRYGLLCDDTQIPNLMDEHNFAK